MNKKRFWILGAILVLIDLGAAIVVGWYGWQFIQRLLEML